MGFNSLKNPTPILYLEDSMASQANESVEWLISSAGMIFIVSMQVHLFIPAFHLIHIAILVHKRLSGRGKIENKKDPFLTAASTRA